MQLLAKIIKATILASKARHFKTSAKRCKGEALVTYVMVPIWAPNWFYLREHINLSFSLLIIKNLLSEGYNVTLTRCDDIRMLTRRKIDLFFGHSIHFPEMIERLGPGVRNILLITGSNPNFANEAQKIRALNVAERHKVDPSSLVYDDNIVPDMTNHLELAHSILMIGNSTTLNSWPAEFHHKFNSINNFTLFPIIKSNKPSTKSFLYMSSVGQVHRGLDLLVDSFLDGKGILQVCSRYYDEPTFMRVFGKTLLNTPNIYANGWVDTSTRKFPLITANNTFAMLPTCAEGQSSSLLNLMAFGLLPIATREAGIDLNPSYSISIDPTIQSIRSARDAALNLENTSEHANMKNALLAYMNENHTAFVVEKRLKLYFQQYA